MGRGGHGCREPAQQQQQTQTQPSPAPPAPPPPQQPKHAAGAWGTSISRWLLPEPGPDRPWVHPCRYDAPNNVRVYSDGMHAGYQPTPWTLLFAGLTLGLYIGLPHILLALLVAAWWSRGAALLLALLLGSLLLPARPLRLDGVLASYVFLAWRRYFQFSTLFEQRLDSYKDYVIAQFPHGAFPIGCIVGGTFMATEFPEYQCYALAASSAFLVPIWRHVHAWLGTDVATKTNFHRLLARGVQGPLHRIHAAADAAAAAAAEDEAAAAAEVAQDAIAAAAAAAEACDGQHEAAAVVDAAIAASPFARALQPAAEAAAGGVAARGASLSLQRHQSQPVVSSSSQPRHAKLPYGRLAEQRSSMAGVSGPGLGRAAHSLTAQELKLLHQRSSLRLSLADSIRSSFRHHHTLSDSESSEECDDDSEDGGSHTLQGVAGRLLSTGGTSTTCSCSGAAPDDAGNSRASNGAGSWGGSSSVCSCCGGLRHIPLVEITSSSSRLGKPAATPAGSSLSDSTAHALDQPQQQSLPQQDKPGQAAAPVSAAAAAAAAGATTNWIDPATGRRKTGVSVALMVGGIAEMFMIRPDEERIKLKDRKGFIRIALEHGTDILPVYTFGTNQVLDFGPPWLQRFSRRLRASLGIIYGCWGLPIPRRRPLFMVTGRPLSVGPALRKDDPRFVARVDELHAAFVAEVSRLYHEHRGKYGYGFESRPLVIC